LYLAQVERNHTICALFSILKKLRIIKEHSMKNMWFKKQMGLPITTSKR
jgi:hypothetical protein